MNLTDVLVCIIVGLVFGVWFGVGVFSFMFIWWVFSKG